MAFRGLRPTGPHHALLRTDKELQECHDERPPARWTAQGHPEASEAPAWRTRFSPSRASHVALPLNLVLSTERYETRLIPLRRPEAGAEEHAWRQESAGLCAGVVGDIAPQDGVAHDLDGADTKRMPRNQATAG